MKTKRTFISILTLCIALLLQHVAEKKLQAQKNAGYKN